MTHPHITPRGHKGPITLKGQHEANVYEVCFPVFGESGDFPAVDLDPLGEQCEYFAIHPDLMPEVKK
ncbi:hypothetical protein [Pseudomonas caspiana]|uniref:Uncharacterized protein n=1 Tax=Pseudomonas caspiana TaxID=1451454 RepID=A0A1Y3P7L9_9PSED|nr:hypothetical protein [Pseudomonas caspiana]OUM73563.1 hypothetical protein AUC60_12895 [Pseudomonas caspiana]